MYGSKLFGAAIRALAGCFALVLLSLIASPAQAAFPAINAGACNVGPCYIYRQSAYSPNTDHATFAEACSAYAAAISANSVNYNGVVVSSTAPNCMTALYTKAGAFVANQAAGGVSTISSSPAPLACPSNSTLSGSGSTATCACNTGYNQVGYGSGATCTVDGLAGVAPVLRELNDSGLSIQYAGSGYTLQACYEGFIVKGTGTAYGIKGGVGHGEIYGPFTSDGTTCSGSGSVGAGDIQSQLAPIPCPPGTFTGSVNGVDKCVPPSGTATGTSTTTAPPAGSASAPASGIPYAPAGATTAQESTACAGGTCTTTTTYKDAGGTVVGVGTRERSEAEFCGQNPGASICAPRKSECELSPGTVGCAEFGTPVEQTLPGETVSVALTPVTFSGTATCPAPESMAFEVMGHTFSPSISYAALCEGLDAYVKPVFLLLAVAAAGFLFVGGLKSGA